MGLKNERVVVCGGGGFIGGHLVKALLNNGVNVVRAVDVKPLDEWYQKSKDVENLSLDLRDKDNCYKATDNIQVVFQLAADMGGMGFIENNKALCMLSVLTNTHMLMAAKDSGVERFFYSSSACMYPSHNQEDPDNPNCAEDSAYPANPDSEYGWEKLFSERLYLAYNRNHGMNARVARFHNIFGPEGTWTGGREKAPAAICRKVASARTNGTIDIWGDGKQTRSFLYIEECLEGVVRLMRSSFPGPVNIGSEEMVTINQLADMVIGISGKRLSIAHVSGPLGVRGRNSDNRLIKAKLGWAPSEKLVVGIEKTYAWIEKQLFRNKASGSPHGQAAE